ncbi:MAG: BMP family protein [Bacillota bacterium]
MKKLLSLLLAALLLLTCVACSAQTDTPSPDATDAPAATQPPAQSTDAADAADEIDYSKLKIAMLVPGSISDGGFCQLGAESAEKVRQEFNCTMTVIEAATTDLMVSEAESLAEEGYDVILGHGGQYSTPFAEVAAQYPETWFICTGGNDYAPNQFPVCMRFEEVCYVGGVIAGLMTKSNVIGLAVGGDYPSYTRTTTAFQAGAESVNPNVECLFAVLSEQTLDAGYENTMNQINAGADFIFCNANSGSLGALKAAIEAGIYAFGPMGDYSADAPDTVVASGLLKYYVAYIEAIKKAVNGYENPTVYFVDSSQGVTELAWNQAMLDKLPDGVYDTAMDVYQQIKDHKINLPTSWAGY